MLDAFRANNMTARVTDKGTPDEVVEKMRLLDDLVARIDAAESAKAKTKKRKSTECLLPPRPSPPPTSTQEETSLEEMARAVTRRPAPPAAAGASTPKVDEYLEFQKKKHDDDHQYRMARLLVEKEDQRIRLAHVEENVQRNKLLEQLLSHIGDALALLRRDERPSNHEAYWCCPPAPGVVLSLLNTNVWCSREMCVGFAEPIAHHMRCKRRCVEATSQPPLSTCGSIQLGSTSRMLRLYVAFTTAMILVTCQPPPPRSTQPVVYAKTLDPSVPTGGGVIDLTIPTLRPADAKATGDAYYELNRYMGPAMVSKFQVKDLVKHWLASAKAKLTSVNWTWTTANLTNFFVSSNTSRSQEMLLLSLMTFEQVQAHFNLTRAPTLVPATATTPPPPAAFAYSGPTYQYVAPTVAGKFEPYPGYAHQYYAPPTDIVPVVPAAEYPWPWQASIARFAAMLDGNASQVSTNATNATRNEATSTMLDAVEATSHDTVATNKTNASTLIASPNYDVQVLTAILELQSQFHIASGVPLVPEVAPHALLLLDRSDPLFAPKHHFYGYPNASGLPTMASTWLRSGVTVFTPTLGALANATATNRTAALQDVFDMAFAADISGLVLGLESPSSLWLSPFDRISDEFADLCLGQLIQPDASPPTSRFDRMTRHRSAFDNPSCLWLGNSYYLAAKRRSTRRTSSSLAIASLAAHVAARADNVSAIKASMREARRTYVEDLVTHATSSPVPAMGHGVIFRGPDAANILLEAIKEPEPIHLIQRVLIRLGESSLMTATEMDALYACICLAMLDVDVVASGACVVGS
ncbi:Aste57867_21475 [Aphanomyces stellatus]|uniref:Aste57867_21475 protein n=1 Tax=Aphanomyces stellatus TaxID=120398 RepID=A0A485LJ06_9STRA|nr:hypothetical protein As57867_021406 [Aphanomyces stellatus]VFT98145.1 Aste57867_21475 [Aphanomyces stellatus]